MLETQLTLADIALFSCLAVVLPVYGFVYHKLNSVNKLRLDPNLRIKFFTESIVVNCGTAIAVVLIWYLDARSFTALGMQHENTWSTLIAWLVVCFFISFSAIQYYKVRTSEAARIKVREQLSAAGEKILLLMPRTDTEHRLGMCAGVVAGIAEEIVYRAYLIWVLALFLPTWLAGTLAVIIFVSAHLYQDSAGLIQVAFFAVGATVLFLISGSLLPVVVLHIAVDLLNMSTGRIVSRDLTLAA